MKIGVVILARLTSYRLPGKALRTLQGKEILSWIIDNLKLSKQIDEIILATSVLPSDSELCDFAHKHGIKTFKGNLENVASRFLAAADRYNLKYIIRINGDNLFVNPWLVDQVCEKLRSGYDFVSNVEDRTFPKGMSVEGVSAKVYRENYSFFEQESDFEHVMPFFYRNSCSLKTYYIKNTEYPDAGGRQIAIDTQRDLLLANKVLANVKQNCYKIDLEKLTNEFEIQENKMNFVGQHGPLLIAEIGGNHEGDFEYAKNLTKLAIESDSDFVKFQIYSGNTLVNPIESPERHEHFKKFELSKEQYRELAQIVTNAGKKFMASIWDEGMMDWVDDYNPIYKIGSGDLLAWPLLKNVALRGKPIVLSTGLAKEEEVVATVNYIRACNSLYNDSNFLSVLQCTSMYPIPKSAANLEAMIRLNELTNTTMGYSDHTEGADALKVAVAMGAQVLEYHFTDEREGKEFRDHKVSLTKDEVLDLIEYIKMVNLLKGEKTKRPVPIEIESGHVESFRRAIYPARDIPKGTIITEDDLVVLRPFHGLSSRIYETLIGAVSNRDLKQYEKLDLEYFNLDE